MDVDITIDTVTGTIKIPKSVCGYFSLNMPFSTDISVLRTMFYDQSIVPTPLQVAHCGGTSLLHCALATQTVTPRERVLTQLRCEPIPFEARPQLLYYFVREVLSGKCLAALHYVSITSG